MYNGLRGVNCIYDDGSVIPLDAGPCQEVLNTGASLVDANVSESEITVTTAPPVDWLTLAAVAVALLMIGGNRVRR